MKGSFLTRLLLLALALVAITLVIVDQILSSYATHQAVTSLEQRLSIDAHLLAEELRLTPPSRFQTWTDAAATVAQVRLTLMDSGGRVIASSSHDSLGRDSLGSDTQSTHPEVAEALDGHTGVALDEGTTPGTTYLSLAIPAGAAGQPMVLRLAAPLETSDPAITQTRQRILGISLGSALLALCVAFLISRSLSQRVVQLKRLAGGLLGGERRANVSGESYEGDLESLERSLVGVANELHRLLDRLRYESARREAILSGMAEGVLAVDHELRVTFSNDAFLRTIGSHIAKCEGLSLLEMVRDTSLHELLRSVLVTGEARKLRFHLSAANLRVFDVHATPLEMPLGRGAIAIFHDTTDLERLEQVRKDFVANVSHELRTPLAGIIGYSDTLLDGALEDNENKRRFVDIIRANAIRLASITSDLLVLSELESGTDPPEPEAISVRGVLDATILTVESEARLRDVRLVWPSIENVFVSGSRLRLEQVLLNLIANGIKFNRAGGEVRVSACAAQDGQVTIVVADTGVGIPSQDLPRIFERFYRVDKARSRQVGGTGLGLSIVKHAVERMRGTVHVESTLGKGTVFTLKLPSAQPLPEHETSELSCL